MSFNVHGFGRLAADPESITMSSGVTVTKFTLLAGGSAKNEVATAHYCTAFDRQGIAVNTRCRKGDEIFVDGYEQTTEYVNAEGEKRRATQLIVNGWRFIRSPAPATDTAVDPSMVTPE